MRGGDVPHQRQQRLHFPDSVGVDHCPSRDPLASLSLCTCLRRRGVLLSYPITPWMALVLEG